MGVEWQRSHLTEDTILSQTDFYTYSWRDDGLCALVCLIMMDGCKSMQTFFQCRRRRTRWSDAFFGRSAICAFSFSEVADLICFVKYLP